MRIALGSLLLLACSNLTAPPNEIAVGPASSTSTTAASATAPSTAPTPGGNRENPPSAAQIAGDPETELKLEDTAPGTGPQVKMGDAVLVHYAGKLKNGQQFDASKSHQPPDPLPVTVGQGVIEGFSKGLIGMRVGGKRKVTIPWKMAYGEQGRPPVIPPKSTLIFELELVKIGK
jgi:FKBP-type peptidyl-prolyl cis-trans isomerase